MRAFIFLMLFSSAMLFAGTRSITVLSATVKDQYIQGAQVILQKNGATSVSGTTNAAGQVTLTTEYAADDASVTLIISKSGYSTLVAKGPVDGLTFALSPVMALVDGLRVVLSWAKNPADLDLHLFYPNNHVYFGKRTGTGAALDVDDTDGYGPETITVPRKNQATYKFYVYRYDGVPDLGASGAKVYLYVGASLLRTYSVPTGRGFDTWQPFEINERGEIVETYLVADSRKGGSRPDMTKLMSVIGDAHRADQPSVRTYSSAVTARDPEAAKRSNQRGEEVYQSKDYAAALELFRDAVDLDDTNAQAWSNLGLTYQKLERIPEALTANQAAIQRARGNNANTVRASSYFNNAKIYEKLGDWAVALRNFEWAQAEKPKDAYAQGIARMKEKLRQ